ncbi:hypothetical protein [Pedobacter rhizosphaerae]|uniref:Uncharacterized protein n=1 Tax=Pedobacter rhizosphaerae TaxID=390241 RepID=A0A1H9IQL7_9SPHI|nr:hypothetical protein [Pedobacter rhizosphaerae]SEQ76807.1 hypothetical protein SAMN04488023_10148 [Pedobacter rhizosphaerae]
MTSLKNTQIIHFALCVAVFLFATVTIFINRDEMIFTADFQETAPFNPIFPIVSITTIITSAILYKKMMDKIELNASLDTKIGLYQSAFIVSMALLEGGALLNIVGFLITSNAFFLIFAGLSLFIMIRKKPTKEKLITELNIQYPETEKL